MLKNTFGERLKAERSRLGLTQEALGAVGGVKKLAQISYEQGKRFPDAGYLISIGSIGVDVQYVLFAKPSATDLSDDEGELLAGYRGLDLRGKAGVIGMITGLNQPQPTSAPVFHGDVGQNIYGNIQGPNTVTMPNKGEKK